MKEINFMHHIVVCVFANAQSPLIGLHNFVMPLRASNIAYDQLSEIIFVGDIGYFNKEWPNICYFPKIKIFNVSLPSYGSMVYLMNNCYWTPTFFILSVRRHINFPPSHHLACHYLILKALQTS